MKGDSLSFMTDRDSHLDDHLHNHVQELLDTGRYHSKVEVYTQLKREGVINTTLAVFYHQMRNESFTFPKGFHAGSRNHQKSSERLGMLRILVFKGGITDCAVLAEKMGLGKERVYRLALSDGISLRNTSCCQNVVRKNDHIRDRWIAHEPPLTLEEITEEEAKEKGKKPVSSNRIIQYLIGTEQYGIWKKRRGDYRKEQKEQKKIFDLTKNPQQELVDLLAAYLLKRAVDEGPAAEKAVRYHLRNRNHGNINKAIGLKRLLGLFTDYYHAKEQGKLVSLEELGKPYNIFYVSVGQIFKRADVEPLHGSLDRHVIPRHKKEALDRAIDLLLAVSDIAYFLEIPHSFSKQFWHHRKKQGYHYTIFKLYRGGGKGPEFTHYRHASKIYEALDAGFTEEEACEYAGTKGRTLSQKAFAYVINHRNELETTIIQTLQVLYNKPNHNKPYVTAELTQRN